MLFDTPLRLNPFNQFEFPASSVELLSGKHAEFNAEFKSFLSTQSQIYALKQEHISIQKEIPDQGQAREAAEQKLANDMQGKIEAKRQELTGKWDEFVKDQREIIDLKQRIQLKHLKAFKAQVNFESQADYLEIMKSTQISVADKERFTEQLRQYRDEMLSSYKQFRESHYHKYEQKLIELQGRQQQQQQQHVIPQNGQQMQMQQHLQ